MMAHWKNAQDFCFITGDTDQLDLYYLYSVIISTAILPGHALQTDLSQQHGKGNVVMVQHSSGHSVERHLIRQKPDISTTA